MRIPKVSIIIATYKRHDILGDTLAMVMSQDYANLEVVVVDQTSTPFSFPAELKRTSSATFCYHWVPRPNLPAARNIGLKLTSGEIVIFLDDDVAIGRDYVSAIADTYRADDIGGVCGVSMSPDCPDQAVAARNIA